MTADGSRYAEALAGSRRLRERHWRTVAKAEGIPVHSDWQLAWVGRFKDGFRRAATDAEKAAGIPEGWVSR